MKQGWKPKWRLVKALLGIATAALAVAVWLAVTPSDLDADGWTVKVGDCNDLQPEIHPAAAEVCDGIDNNCDGAVDEGVKDTYYRDVDSDEVGGSIAKKFCSWPEVGFAAYTGDCNDTNGAIHPGADEACDGIDNNCDGRVDEFPACPTPAPVAPPQADSQRLEPTPSSADSAEEPPVKAKHPSVRKTMRRGHEAVKQSWKRLLRRN
ncbi:MAG: putative metal-binding motif-containing protein [Candidatus Kerfeldbacteria bacterium]|nr:putative metal-binding motif-containing protein [Candidatus Kerfeldbacteria bacterium]